MLGKKRNKRNRESDIKNCNVSLATLTACSGHSCLNSRFVDAPRQRVSSATSAMEGDQGDGFERCLEILQEVMDESGRMRRDLKDKVIFSMNKLREIFNIMTKESIEKEKEIANLNKQITKGENTTTASTSTEGQRKYSDMVKSNRQSPEKTKTFKIIVKSKKKDSTENMKTLIKQKVNPTEIKVGVCTFKSLKNGNILMESSSKADAEKICSSINEKCGDAIEANEMKLRNPRMILYNVPEEMDMDQLKQAISEQNAELNITEDDFEPKFVFKDRKGSTNLVIAIKSEVRRAILGRKIKVGWHMCNVDDYIKISRCFKCSKYNHRAQECTGEQTCPLCTGNHHMRDCTARKEQYKCINCVKHNQYNNTALVNENHSSMDKECKSYKTLLNRYILNTDY